MKKNILFISLVSFAISSEMPPMPPGFFDSAEPKKEQKQERKVVRDENQGQGLPKECEVIPPMLFMLPPPLKADLDACTKKLYQPKDNVLLTKLSKIENDRAVEIVSIEGIDEFGGSLYKVTYRQKSENSQFRVLNATTNLKTIYTNSQATKFFKEKPDSL